MRGRLKGLKLVKLRYIVDRSGCDGVLQNGVGFASVGLDGSLGFQGIELGSDLISDSQLLLSIQNLIAPARLRRRQLSHHHVVSLSLSSLSLSLPNRTERVIGR